MNINIIITRLSPKIKAMTTPNEDGTYTIIVNEALSQSDAIKAVVHELHHIDGNDFTAESQATILEEMVARNKKACNLHRYNFFYHYIGA